MPDYIRPEVLVSTDWLANRLEDANLRIVEIDVDPTAYEHGHIPGALSWAWETQLCDTVQRDILSKDALEALLSSSGIRPENTVILYGDSNNWFAAWAFWQMKIYGHEDVRILDGGRKKWIIEGRDLTREVPQPQHAQYRAQDPDLSLRAFLPQVQEALRESSTVMIDVRSPQEFTGEILAPPGLPETCQRGGHIPGAQNVPWSMACSEDGSFKSFDDLKRIYLGAGADGSKPVITYCRIGERSSHTWFVLKYLLGYHNIMNYDGSWTEWGNLVGAPVARGEERGKERTAP
jgi:thiosulfate/3-mercaptopyruvate sulfurtransferase